MKAHAVCLLGCMVFPSLWSLYKATIAVCMYPGQHEHQSK